ncbi:MAG: hypothetical protein AB1Z57_04470 [Acidimicrobiia bacterium]
MARRIFVDTEWTATPWSGRAELMWIGLADEAGRAWHAISADADIDSSNDFTAGVWRYISPDDPRSTSSEMAADVVAFCGDVDEFWAWIPTMERFAEWFGLGDDATDVYASYWDWDLQMLQSLVDPWPDGWPDHLHDLNAAARDAGVEIPPRQANHLAPDVHAPWNRDLYALIREARAD